MNPRIEELISHLKSEREVLRAAFEAVPAEARETSPAPGRWSPAAIVEHLSIVQARLAGIISTKIAEARAAGIGPETSFEPIVPAIDQAHIVDRTTRVMAPDMLHPTGLSADAAWAALERADRALHEALRSGDGLALGDVIHPHPRFGPMSIYQWAAFTGAHEVRHAAQIREIISEV